MIRDHVLEIHQEARDIKEHYWYHHNEPDPPPLLSVRWRDGAPLSVDIASAAMMVSAMHRHFPTMPILGVSVAPDDEPSEPLVLYVVLNALADGVGIPGIEKPPHKSIPIEEIRFNVEGYAQKVEGADLMTPAEVAEVHPEHDYKTNPASTVRETMMTYLMVTGPLGTAEWGRATSVFKRGDGGRIEWDEPLVTTSDDQDDSVVYDRLLQVMAPIVTREKLV